MKLTGYRNIALLLTSSATITKHSSRFASSFSITRPFRFQTAVRQSMTTATTSDDTNNNNIRVALLQFHVTHNKHKNFDTCTQYIEKAARGGAQLLVLPEIWNSPYATAAFGAYAETADGPSTTLLQSAARKHNVWIIGGSIPEVEQEKYYNTCFVVNPQGNIVAKHRKVHLFDIHVPGKITFYESETLSPGNTVTTFDAFGTTFGIGICYDIRFAEYSLLLRQRGCTVLVFPGAFNMTTGPLHWELLQRARANDNQCFVLTASPARSTSDTANEIAPYPHYTAWGHSTAVSPWGEVLATTDENEGIVFADLDLNLVDEVRSSIPILKQLRGDLYKLEPTDEK
jgi:omega-amidase